MTPERWQQVKDIFDRAVECGPASRLAYVRERCGEDEELRKEVEALVAADTGTGSILDNPMLKPRSPSRSANMEGRLIGPYRMLREIGRGGMGVVYLAERADQAFRRLVAIKVVHAGLGNVDMIARFDQEREILASLDHPNIARLIDGGVTPGGLSFLVMEYVEGHAIDVYCDEQKLNIAARLNLFRTVCAAVECAHQRHVIHRDLKPANILVTAEGAVKLLDFGIAKLLPGRDVESTALVTRAGMCLMTPEYASPEQIRGEAVGAATDVYALGVVLYELLTGQLPYRLRSRIFHEIVRVICEEPPTRPSSALSESGEKDRGAPGNAERISRVRRTSPADLRRSLSGDLDGIVLKALEKLPFDRYRSASSLSSDIERHLEGRPVVARQATIAYRGGKFMQRNLPWMILAVALVAAFATGGISINRTAAAVIGVCVAAVGLWYAATNRVAGGRIAESEFLFDFLPGPFWLAILAIAVLRTSEFWPPVIVVCLVLFVVCVRQAVGWMGRGRYAGSLILDMNTVRNYWIWVWVFGSVLSLAGGFPNWKGEHYYWMDVLVNGLKILWLPIIFFLDGRLEIRARGIVDAGTLYSWERIESHEWLEDPSEKEKTYCLKLRLRRGIQFLPPVRISVAPGRRDEVEAIVSRYLSEWPDEMNSANEKTQ